ncbi:hypothetical protein VPH35_093642 [Triticum aestivum]
MSSASSALSGLRGRTVVVPLIPCPRCQATVRYYVSNTEDHEGWVFYRCPNHSATGCDFWFWEMEYVVYLVDAHFLVGNQAVDAVGATEERREELIRARNERRRIAAQVATSRAALARPGSLQQNMSRHQKSALIGLGAEILVLLKLLLGSVMLLCALCVLLLMKK